MTSDFSSPALKRLYALVISTKDLPKVIDWQLFQWEVAVDRGVMAPAEIDAWATRIADSIAALGRPPTCDVIGYPTPPGDPPTCSPSW